jgi:rhodanese-related sulfurtransferase
MIKLTFVLMSLLFATLGARADVLNIDNTELARLSASGVAVIDIRTAPEWKETGIVPGSHLFTLFDDKGRADAPSWLDKVKSVAKPEQPVILICRSGNRTRTAAQFLSQQAGYRTVYNVTKGIQAWAKDGRPMAQAANTANAKVACTPNASC